MARGRRAGSLQAAIIVSFTLMVAAILLIVMIGLGALTSRMLREDAVARTRQTVTQGNASLGVYMSGALETRAVQELVREAEEWVPALTEHMRLVKRSARTSGAFGVRRGGEVLASHRVRTRSARRIRAKDWFSGRSRPAKPVSVSQPY